MTRTTRSPLAAAAVAALALAMAAACGDEGGGGATPSFDYSAQRVAPPEGEGYGYPGSETGPDPEDSVQELALDSGAAVVIWIDEDGRSIYQQHSEPDAVDAWTEPTLLFEAGDGCTSIDADTNGETVAATLQCYEVDTFVQQAPDEAQAVVTIDLKEWQIEPYVELFGEPVVSDDGDEVNWKESDLRWTASDGFRRG